MTQPTKTLISFATAWGTQFGGINAFNADLLRAVAAAFFQHLRTVCVVLTATDADEQDANNSNVVLINLNARDTKKFSADLEPKVWELLQEKLSLGEQHTIDTVWLGHDRITGAIALKAAQCRGGKTALIHHMSYTHYEAHAENSAIAHQKETEQKSLFAQATYRIGIGPLLKNALDDLVEKNDATELIPGLAEISPRAQATNRFNVFMSGRLSDDAKKVKQAHLGLAGFGHAVALCDADPQYPDTLKGKNSPQMKLRGVAFENMPASQSADDAEASIRRFVEEHAKRVLPLSLLPFTQDRESLLGELRNASVALMPSWHEGFGLVAWEAIAAGVPLVLSQNSGVYQLLEGINNGMFTPLVQGLDLQGQVDDPFFTDTDKNEVAKAIITVARAPETWRNNSARLREELLKHYTWARCAMNFVAAVGWQLPLPRAAAQRPTEQSVSQTAGRPAAPQLSQISGLDYPKKQWLAGHGYALSLLLKAEESIVPFDANRQSFLQQQIDWATQTPWPLGIRLLTGQGGTGKTRLGLELCQQLANQGWQMGFLPGKTNQPVLNGIAAQLNNLASQGTACCVVVDYAETQQQALLFLLGELLKQPKPTGRIRFLLLARDGGEWWSQLPHQQPACENLLLGEATSGPYVIPSLHHDIQTRLAAYQTALACFANELKLAQPESTPNLEADHFGHPLHVQMAALLALHGETHQTADSLPRALIGHEQRYWAKVVPTGTNTDSAIALMTLATLAGGFASARDVEPLWKSSELPPADLKPLWKALAPLYPGEQGLQGLRPDLLGESLVAQTLLSTAGQALVSALLGNGSNPAWRLSTLTVLARVLRTRDDVAQPIEAALRQHLPSCAHELCAVGIATPSPLIDVAVRSFQTAKPNQQSQVAGILKNKFQHEALPLSHLAVVVGEFICNKQERIRTKQANIEASADLSRSLLNLSVDYHRNGQKDRALEMAQRALDIYERLAQQKPERFEPEWAGSLNNYANHLANMGQHDRALEMAQRALDIYERLGLQKPERFEPEWAMSLNNCANRLADMGQHDRALEMAQRALGIRERLGLQKPERFEPEWAGSLNNCANHLANMGQHDRALEMAQRALDIYQRLAQQKPERFEPDWAMSLNNCANRLADMGQHDRALEMAQRALGIYQRLAQQKPERFEPDWAMSLNNCANCLADMGQHDRALEMAQRALDIYQRLALRLPNVHAITAHNTALNLALWHWIDSGQEMTNVLSQDLPEGHAHQLLELQYVRKAMRALHMQSAPIELFKVSAVEATNAWLQLDRGQQRNNETLFHLSSALAVHRLGIDSAPRGWLAQWQAYRARIKHGLPKWMEKGIRRCGAEFPLP